MSKAIVIGAGIAGLAAAIRLRHKGYQVTVIETNIKPGGKLQELNYQGYRFDLGPSLFTMPHLVDDLFRLHGKNPRDYYNYKKLDTLCHYFWEDGTFFKASSKPELFIKQASEVFDEPETHIRNYIANSEKKYNITAPVFLQKSLHKIGTYTSKNTLKALFKSNRLAINSSLDTVNKRAFENKKLIQFFNRFATYNGSSPYLTPGIMSMIPHLELNMGAYFPNGGMSKITDSLFNLAKEVGVNFRFDEKVTKIEVQKNKVKGVIAAKNYDSDVVVSNSDIYFTQKDLLPTKKNEKKTKQQERSSSAIIFYWGISRQFASLHHHNIFFSRNYQKEFDDIFKKHIVPSDPTIYVNITSKNSDVDAPKGHENWFVMVNAPSDYGQDWGEFVEKTRRVIIDKLSKILKTDIGKLIECEFVYDPTVIEKRTGSFRGSLYGTSSNSKFAAFLRHPNFDNKIKGMYYCGGSVHPGGGIPLCLFSAQITCDIIPNAS